MKIPTDPKDVKSIREFLTTVRSQVCGMADYLSEPWKTHFNDLKKHYDDALASLPPTDMVPAANEAHHHLSCFYSCLANANALASMLGSAMDSMIKKNAEQVATALNSAVDAKLQERLKAGELVLKVDVDAVVTKAIGERTKAGELVEKELHHQLCSAAKDLGLKEGEQKVRTEIEAEKTRKAKIGERKTHLQTCGLPIPDEKLESVLGGSDDDFKTAQKLAEDRLAALAKKGVALNSESPLRMRVWLPQDQYEIFELMAIENLKSGDGLVTSNGAPGSAPKVMIC